VIKQSLLLLAGQGRAAVKMYYAHEKVSMVVFRADGILAF
jgi:hypothetical protein